jgi:predicted dehydrogenase
MNPFANVKGVPELPRGKNFGQIEQQRLMDQSRQLTAGIVGTGFAASFQFEALRRVYGVPVKVAGAYSRSAAKVAAFTGPRGIAAFESLEALIEGCEVVHVCTPPVTHEPIVIAALAQDKHVIVEKPFTGYFGDGTADFHGATFSREVGLEVAQASLRRMLAAEARSQGSILYAENWIYAPAIQKEKEVIEKTAAHILWIQGQQSHSGSHSSDYGQWRLAGGGSLMGKGAHPLTAALYLKQVEGRTRLGTPIRPQSVSCRTHAITRLPQADLQGNLRDSYHDVEDYACAHIVFDDGSVADIVASELLQGGVKNYLEVHANNHRTICNIAPNNAMQAFNPAEAAFADIYVVEKGGTKQGWSHLSPDEAWFNGYQHEMEAFYTAIATGGHIESNSLLAADAISTIYAGYLSAARGGQAVDIPETMSSGISDQKDGDQGPDRD